MYEQILYEVDDPVATITLNRPERLNAWTDRMRLEVRHAMAAAEDDPSVVGIVITGAGRGFCAGADLVALASLRDGQRDAEPLPDELAAVDNRPRPEDFDGEYTYLMAVPKPVVAAINGPVAGMGVPIALSCDLRFMDRDAVLVTAFAERGLTAEWGLGWLLPRLVGTGHSLDLLFSSRRVSGEECASMGLVNRAVDPGQALAVAQEYVRDLARRCSPASIATMKRQVYDHLAGRLGAAEKEAFSLMIDSFNKDDFREGLAAFTEKRPPSFGRLGRS